MVPAAVTVINPSPRGGTSDPEFVQTTAAKSVNFSKSDIDLTFGNLLGQPIVADFNGDGNPDVAVTAANSNSFPNSVEILLGNGDGTFQPAIVYQTGDFPYGLATGDFNGDGKLDLAVVNVCGSDSTCRSGSTVSILLGNGNGTFQSQTSFVLGIASGHIVVADFNSDGKLDLSVTECGGSTCNSNGNVAILLGNGDGTFQPRAEYATAVRPTGLAAGDFNGDGFLDIAAANTNSNSISVLLGNGNGTFKAQVSYHVLGAPVDLIASDFNGDGKLDLAAGYASGSSLAVLLGNGDGTFQPVASYSSGCCTSAALIAGDFNGDGKLDLVAGGTNQFSVLTGNGDGTFQTAVDFTADSTVLELAAGDFNRDGALDLAVSYGNSTLSVFQQTASVPVVSFSPSSLTYPVTLINSRGPTETTTLTNTGTADLHISSITMSGDFIEANDCPATLPATQSCTISVTYRPRHRGTVSGAVTVVDDAQGGSQTVALTGACIVISVDPTRLSFGAEHVGTTSRPLSVVVTNHDTLPVTFTKIVFVHFNPEEFSAQTSGCTTIPGSSHCTIQVYFTPQFLGFFASYLQIGSDAGGGFVGPEVFVEGAGALQPSAKAAP